MITTEGDGRLGYHGEGQTGPHGLLQDSAVVVEAAVHLSGQRQAVQIGEELQSGQRLVVEVGGRHIACQKKKR